jgi:hypothetical protein
MNIKVKRMALIKALEKALKARLEAKATYDKASEAYAAEIKAFEATILEAVTSGKVKVSSVHISNYLYGHTREVTLNFQLDAKKFKRPEMADLPYTHSFTGQIKEMENAIAILNLSEEEYVNASTYKSVSQYIS